MRLIVTGGGTGGHVYPALEIGRAARDRGAEVSYFGSLRGQESRVSTAAGFSFHGFPSEPQWSLRSFAGWRAMAQNLRAIGPALAELRSWQPDAVFSTGGYAAAPILAAARKLRVPYVVHEANSVPGRVQRLFAGKAAAFTCVFRYTEDRYRSLNPVRTGQPIRRELVEAASVQSGKEAMVLVLGGSQGSAFLNDVVPKAAALVPSNIRFVHSVGVKNAGSVAGSDRYRAAPYIETEELSGLYQTAGLVIGRSGGTLAEVALFGIPSILIPLPTSADDHQLHNALEFQSMSSASVFSQSSPSLPATPEAVAREIERWLGDPSAREVARRALGEWSITDATERILGIVESVAR